MNSDVGLLYEVTISLMNEIVYCSYSLLQQQPHPLTMGLSECCNMSCVMRKLDFCLCENKDADQLYVNRTADQHLCFFSSPEPTAQR